MKNLFGRALTALLLVVTLLFANALTCFAEDNPRQAIQKYTAEIQRNPNNAEAYYKRGDAYNDLEQYDKAIADFSKAIQIKPNYADPYFSRALIYYLQNQYRKAIVDLTKFIELNPENPVVYLVRSRCYSEIGDSDRAEADYVKAKKLTEKQGVH